ncbi:MAG: hypothetical protein ACM3O3_05590 [Syntrophothermus sp.]
MRRLSFIILIVFFAVNLKAQSPHGESFDKDCSLCHQTDSWKVIPEKIEFEHNKETSFQLIGQHQSVQCRSCHTSLVFKQSSSECLSCHKDIHQNTVGRDCSRCHSPKSWSVNEINLIHQQTRFPLVGNHLNADCSSCHSNYAKLVFEPLDVNCFSCHKKDFLVAQHPNHQAAGFSTNCIDCHNINSATWSASNINHDFFPLVGGHNLPSCFSCHQQNTFQGLSKECYSCHKSDYEATKDPNHLEAGFPTDCSQCHNINKWDDADFDHNQTEFPLTGAHQTVDCKGCHITTYANTSKLCISCHQLNFNGTQNPNHSQIGISSICENCHTTSNWSPSTFNHSNTNYPLTGKHTQTECASCHKGSTTGTLSDCYSCHKTNYDNSINPNHKGIGINTDCQTCHTTSGYIPSTFSHNNTTFPLTGKHIEANCQSCHNGITTGTNKDCYSCHQNNYNTALNHVAQNFPKNCEMCHNTTNWDETNFNHSNTNFPLTGAHINTNCSSCHLTGYTGTSSACVSCHQVQYNLTANPSHSSLGLSTQCQDCHTTNPTWKPALFPVHNNYYILEGAHLQLNCSTCHNGSYNNTPNTCLGCHQQDYNNTTNPNHIAAGFPTDCKTCHSQSAWTPASFDHDARFFPIYSGKHQGQWQNCSDCHTTVNNFSVFSCIDCHEHNKLETDGHHSGVNGYVYASQNCYACHPNGSTLGAFNHSLTTFPLTGAHININCINCHQSGYVGTSKECKSCHLTDYNGAQNPNHLAAGIPKTCENCHTASGFVPSSFNHTTTGFELTGKHNEIQCSSCHSGTVLGLNNLCINCHQNNFNNAPNHVSQQYPTTCERCHSTSAWTPASFNHSSTNFPLTGAHININCSSCHTTGYTNTPSSCVSCHQEDYNGSTNPNHSQLALPNQCSDCHTTNPNWTPATFPIHNNYYPLQGAHINVNCSNCHNGNYTSTPNTCIGCHLQDYNGTTNPNHLSAGFPTTCSECHNQNAWVPSTFNHDQLYFPIYSGKHNGRWDVCSDCHTNPNNFNIFECINCHEHNRTNTDEHHQGVNNYIYLSTACYDCHPNGNSDKSLLRRRIDEK